jgi:DNA ligase D-like protein (predicted 3'-phosphoesterase)
MIRHRNLGEYRRKRDFRKSPEPAGAPKEGPRTNRSGRDKKTPPIFVIQKHAARSLHYDFRLEVDGVLASWAVPRGPSTDPKQKRLAVHVEDHPLDYADFEGIIPQNEYGGGTVIVWDKGFYGNLRQDENGREIPMSQALEDGHIEIWVEGEKLHGGYALIRTKMRGEHKNWLLVKMKDKAADARRNPTKTQPQSVLTGRTLEEIAETD